MLLSGMLVCLAAQPVPAAELKKETAAAFDRTTAKLTAFCHFSHGLGTGLVRVLAGSFLFLDLVWMAIYPLGPWRAIVNGEVTFPLD